MNVDELYLGFNGIEKVDGMQHFRKLNVLDLSRNKLEKFDSFLPFENLRTVTDLWLHANKVDDLTELSNLNIFENLTTLYLEHNPIQKDWEYRKKIKKALPQLKQIDANPC